MPVHALEPAFSGSRAGRERGGLAREAAREAGARVVEVEFENFAQMRTAAVAAVRSDWVLMLDADETLEGDPRPLLERPAIWEMPRRHWADLERVNTK